jgi:hypothetical protein
MDWWYACANPDLNHRDIFGNLDPCHENLSAPSLGCDGTCVPVSPAGWSEPVLLWQGALAAEPECPTWAPASFKQGRSDLTWSPTTCLACECTPPTGTCALPPTITASSKSCNDSATTLTVFDPPVGWTGECTETNAIPAGEVCGGIPCVQSVTIKPLVLTESECTPSVSTPPTPPPGPADSPSWTSHAITCGTNHSGVCSNPGEICAPSLPPPPPGFHVCISGLGDHECFDPYPVKYVTYQSFKDERMCTPCSCAAPSGSTCTGAISIYSDSACGASMPVPVPLLTLTVGSASSQCGEVLPGYALASKNASPLTYSAGMCQPSGGEPTGSPQLIDPTTYCCQP